MSFLRYFVDLCGLNPAHQSVGSRVWHRAYGAAAHEVLRDGSYEGIDIVPQGIEWCRKQSVNTILIFVFSSRIFGI